MSTSRLLDIYIDLLRQSERTQKLLLDPDWKGATEVSSFHQGRDTSVVPNFHLLSQENFTQTRPSC